MSHAARLKEAAECERKAQDCMKTSMIKLKFNPDYDGAASAMERAAVCYRNAQDPKKASESLLKAAEYYEQNRNFFHAAKAREGAAMLLRDMKQFSEAVLLFEKAINGYAESGSLDTAAMTVEKAADVLKNDDPKKALQIYQRGLALVQQSDRAKMASNFLKQITKMSLQLEDYKGALASIREEVEKFVEVREYPRIGQLGIGLVLVNLAMEDSVAALKDYSWVVSQSPDFQLSEDGRVCENLIGYYEAGDDQSFQNVLKCGALRSMDNEYLRVMKVLKAPSGIAGVGEDEEDEGLC
uniref:Gamma-soluble NSF attachment protein n=1 Tax=Caenorhabditis tropicalis TaxID=1561998 RepID=A0A1I7V317_9PELO